ncbi:GmrSD restriction endonuclease domain-containing protein [Nocardia sp. NBC_01327]|uniref:GmrSD restriction endonuclease domain-containing protein n=1 Tax=Nocardia sp. NBC_01327 TaxID=2903593 RepID=UPI002E1017C2|nr:DUF1524 domain-containing protein [Nocardia sp. NBC_01327]
MLQKKPSRLRKLLLPLAIAGLLLVTVIALVLTNRPGPRTPPTDEVTQARSLLERLPVQNRAPKTDYNREQFGLAWSDDVAVSGGHNGCDTRNDILQRDLRTPSVDPREKCKVVSGTLSDVYTGKTIVFTQGRDTSSAVQIDHIVALSNAWMTGAQQLSPEQRRNLANDPRNLQAVDGPTNQGKGDSDAAEWLPPRKDYQCTYVARQIQVKSIYSLWVTRAEHDAMAKVLSACGATTPAAPATSTVTIYFKTCDEVRAAGKAPLRRNDPGYRLQLDGNGDGVACE